MPITQERFLSVIEDAEAALDVILKLREMLYSSNDDIRAANTALAAPELDPITKEVISNLQSRLLMSQTLLYQYENVLSDARANIGGERKYFSRVAKANKRSAENARLRRASGGTSFKPANAPQGTQALRATDIERKLIATLPTEDFQPWSSPPAAGQAPAAQQPAAQAPSALSADERSRRREAELAAGFFPASGPAELPETLDQARQRWREARAHMSEAEWRRKAPAALFEPEEYEVIAIWKKKRASPKQTQSAEEKYSSQAKPLLPPVEELNKPLDTFGKNVL